MNIQDELRRLEKLIWEIKAFEFEDILPLEDWQFHTWNDTQMKEIHVGDTWPTSNFPVYFETTANIPASWKNKQIWLNLWVGGEGLVTINGKPFGGIDINHQRFPILEKSNGDEEVGISVEVVPKGESGISIPNPRFERAFFYIPDPIIYEFLATLINTFNAAKHLEDTEVKVRLINLLKEALTHLFLPGSTDDYLTMFSINSDIRRPFEELWDPVNIGRKMQVPFLPKKSKKAISTALKDLKKGIEEIATLYPPRGRLSLTGHSHLDLIWLWPLDETRRKARRTFWTVVNLMDRDPEFIFVQSSPQLYAFVKEDDPELYERIGNRIKEGRWEITGGSWVEMDCNLPGGESLVRQFLFGQQFFEREFGKKVRIGWFPDTFGFSWSLPQIMKKSGIDYFFTTKLTWSKTNTFPYDLFWWKGVDGTRILSHSFLNPNLGFNGMIEPLALLSTWKNFKQKDIYTESLFTFGHGDGGGGVTLEMLENYHFFKKFPALPHLEMKKAEEFFEDIPKDLQLPTWNGELYLEYHRGTYTTQSKIKAMNRRLEDLLYQTEVVSSLAFIRGQKPYPKDEITRAWKILLRYQFHDVLPGSSIHRVYDDAFRELNACEKDLLKIRNNAISLKRSNDTFLVYNLNSFARPLRVKLPIKKEKQFKLIDSKGEEIPYQAVEDGIFVDHMNILPFSYTRLKCAEGKSSFPTEGVKVTNNSLENSRFRVTLSKTGAIESIYDKRFRREIFDGEGNQLWVYVDKPADSDAWNIDENYTKDGIHLDGVSHMKIIENGPVRGIIKVKKRFKGSTIIQRYILTMNSSRLDIHTKIDWHERRTILKALFPLNILSSQATYEIPYGAVSRPAHRNTSWDKAKFEVSAHRWVDKSEAGYGVSILNNSKYGHNALDNIIGITLLRSPIYPDFTADEGEQEFTYSVYPHESDWRNGTVQEAIALNSPLMVFEGECSEEIEADRAVIKIFPENLVASAVKKAELSDDIVLRLYEAYGGRGEGEMRFSFPIQGVEETNLLEEEGNDLVEMAGNGFRFSYKPFEIKTFKIHL
ncbi:MAG: alpha-mannosidase [Thermotogae bacterium]|nr:alpha-mannosidase [Thermotogota bacterium]